MKQATRDNLSWWHTILSRITSTDARTLTRQAKATQLMLIWAVVLTIIYVVGYFILLDTTPINTLWRLVFFMILYGISRTRLFVLAALLFIAMLLIQPYVALVVSERQADTLIPIITSIFALPVTILLFDNKLRGRLLVLVGGIELFTIIVLTATIPLAPQIGFILIIMTLGMLVLYQIYALYWLSDSDIHTQPYHRLVEISPDLMALIVQGQFSYINQAGLKMLGLQDASDIIGSPLDRIIRGNADDTASSNRYITRTSQLSDMIIQSIETIERPDGETMQALVTVTPFEQDGTLATLLTAKPLSQPFNQAEQILESSTALTSVQRDGKLLYVSSHFERLTGYPREEVYSADYTRLRFTYEEDRERVQQWLDDIYRGVNDRKSIEYRMYRKDGSVIWVSTSGSVIRHNGKPAILTTTVDLAPLQALSQHKPIQDEMPIPWLLVKTQDGLTTIVDYHHAHANWLTEKPSLIGQSLADVIIGLPQDLSSLIKLTSPDNHTYVQRNLCRHADGSTIPIEWTATPITDNAQADYLITLRSMEYETQLEDDLHRYRTMFDMMNDYAFLLKVLPDGGFEYVWVSSAFEMMTGYNPYIDTANDIIIGSRYPDDRSRIEHHIDQLMRGEMSISEHRMISKLGQVRWVREYAYPVVEDSRTVMIYGSVSDITDHVKAEEAMRTSALQQAVIAEIGMVAVRGGLEITDFAHQALSLVTQLIVVPWCVLMEYHPDDQLFTVCSIIGEAVPGAVESTPDNPNSYLGYVLDQNDPVIIRDWSTETRFKIPQAYLTLGIQTSLSVVVHTHDKPFGILSIHDHVLRQFSGEQINLLQTVANIIGAYIQQQHTQHAEHEQRMMAEALSNIAAVLNSTTELNDILRLILNFVAQIVPIVDSANIILIDRDKKIANLTIRHTVNPDIPDAPVGQQIPLNEIPYFVEMIETGKPVVLGNVAETPGWHVVPETRWIKSYLGAPIFAGNQCIGVVSLDSMRLNAFTTEHVEQMQAFLNQASIAIQNAQHTEQLAQEVDKRTRELQFERAQLQAILDSTGEGIFYSRDKDKTMWFINKALADMMGYEPDELLGKSSHIFRPDDLDEDEINARINIENALITVGITRAEIRFKRKDGSTFMGGVTASRISNQDGAIEAVTVVRDISREKAIEAQKETFISNAAHELRGPITTLNTRMYIMKNQEHLTQEDVAKVDVVVQKMNALVAGLLDLSRFESGRIQLNLQSIILQKILDEIMEYQLPEAGKKQTTLHYTAPEEPITMIGDPLRLNQVLTNLVSNSINYTPEGGKIDIIADYTDETMETVIIEVIDNGIGIDEESLKTIFQPFLQAQNNTLNTGTGLGLSISKQIVEAHGGEIKVESIEGKGSRFIVYLPISTTSGD